MCIIIALCNKTCALVSGVGTPFPVSFPTCSSPLRVIRAAAPHYPVLRGFLWKLYSVNKKHVAIKAIDSMLSNGNVDELIEYLGLKDNLPKLLSEDGAEHPIVSEDHSSPGLGCIERHLLVTHAALIAELMSKFNDDAEFFPVVAVSVYVGVQLCLVLTSVTSASTKQLHG